MQIIRYSDPDFPAQLAKLTRRAIPDVDVKDTVESILNAVRDRGDEALIEFAQKFDKAELTADGLRVTEEELEQAKAAVDQSARDLIAASVENVTAFAQQSMRQD